jgi:hypothetical protein
VGILHNNVNLDGTADIVLPRKFLSPEDLMIACGLDSSRWVCESFTGNTWQSAMGGQPDGKIDLCQTKGRFKQMLAPGIEEKLKELVADCVKPLNASKLPRTRSGKGKPYMVTGGIWDAHLGAYAWSAEVGEDYDLDIATNRVCNSIDDLVEDLLPYNVGKLYLSLGNDFMHYDSMRNTTTFGDHQLDTDDRFAKVYAAALKCLCYLVERFLPLCDDIEGLFIPGNHDYTSAYTLCLALAQRYRLDPRIRFDLGPNPRKWRTFGGTLIMWDHGQGVKADRYPMLLAEEARSVWSQTTYREVQVGHLHQRYQKHWEGTVPLGGVTLYRHPALCGTDYWHHSKGFVGESMRSAEVRRFDEVGFRGAHSVWARDQQNDSIEAIAL